MATVINILIYRNLAQPIVNYIHTNEKVLLQIKAIT